MNTIKSLTSTLVLLLILSNNSFAQDNDEPQYLIDLKTVKISAFGGTISEFSKVDGGFGFASGGGGALLFNYNFYIGCFGTTLETDHSRPNIYPIDHNPTTNPLLPRFTDLQLSFENNGLWVGYINNHKNLVHWGANMKLGHGIIGVYDKDTKFDRRDILFKDNVFVASPEIEVEFNIVRWCKVNMGVGYRFVAGVGNNTYTNIDGDQKILYQSSQFNSPYATVKFLFGGFAKRERSHRKIE